MKIRIPVGIALAVFIFVIGNILAFGMVQSIQNKNAIVKLGTSDDDQIQTIIGGISSKGKNTALQEIIVQDDSMEEDEDDDLQPIQPNRNVVNQQPSAATPQAPQPSNAQQQTIKATPVTTQPVRRVTRAS